LSAVASSADNPTKDEFVPGKEVKGTIVQIEGENIVVREESGAEVHMHFDATTRRRSTMAPKPKVGDNILAKVDKKGHALSLWMPDASISH
jgi:ribosomal protein S1